MNPYRRWLLKTLWMAIALAIGVAILGKVLFIDRVFQPAHYRVDASIDTLITGASHSACSFAPAAFGRAINASRHGELVFFTYYKLQALLDANPQLETVILSFGPIHIAEWQDANLFGRNKASRTHFMDYFMLVDEPGRECLDRWSSDYVLATLKYDYGLPLSYMDDAALLLKYYTGRIRPTDMPFLGAYTAIEGSHLSPEMNRRTVDKYFYPDGELAQFSELAIGHVWKMLALTHERSIRTVLVSTPVNSRFRAEIPLPFTERYRELVEQIRAKYPDVLHFEFADLDYGDELFLDPDHLNLEGSQRFSALLAERMRSTE